MILNFIAVVFVFFLLINTKKPIVPTVAYFLFKTVSSVIIISGDPSMGAMVPFAFIGGVINTAIVYAIGKIYLNTERATKYIPIGILCVPLIIF